MPADDNTIRPFKVGFPEGDLADLRRRINATRWPERETVTDDSQGVRLAMMQDLARYWGTDYDWRRGFIDGDVRRTTARAHWGITEAIRAQDPDAALRRMNKHVHAYAEAVRVMEERTAVEVAND
jgi:Epoxide hydrolase N terminus/FCD domain